MRRSRKKLYCGRGIQKRAVSFDFVLRTVFLGLVVVLAIVKLPEARAKVLGSSVFRLDSVSMKGNKYLLDSQILRIARVEKGTCGFSYDADVIRARLEKHPRIKSASVKKLLWKKMYIDVEERIPFALLRAQKLLEMDQNGVVFEPVNPAMLPDVPVITGLPTKGVCPGDTLKGERVEQVIALLEKLCDPEVNIYCHVSEVNVGKDGSIVIVGADTGLPVILGSEQVSKKKLQALKVAMADMQRKKLLPASVDLRFEGQVVVTILEQPASNESDKGGTSRYALF